MKGGCFLRYHHLIWDFDGTLFDTYPAITAAFAQALHGLGYAAPEPEIAAQLRVSMANAVRHYCTLWPLPDDFAQAVAALRAETEAEYARPFPGAVDICRQVCAHGGHNYLNTHRGASALALLRRFGFADYFADAVTGALGLARKPSPEGVFYLLHQHHIAPADALMIGDRALDIDAGHGAGIATCYFSSTGETLSNADYNICTLAELADILGMTVSQPQ